MRVLSVSGNFNFKSRNYNGKKAIPQGVDYSCLSANQGMDAKEASRIRKSIRRADSLAARERLIEAKIPSTLGHVKGYCPDCVSAEDDDLTQEALLGMVEACKYNPRSVESFERKAERGVRRNVASSAYTESQYAKNDLPIEAADSVTVSIEDCRMALDGKRKETLYGLVESILSKKEAAVLENRLLCPEEQVKSRTKLAQELGVTVEEVRGIESRALKKLRQPQNAAKIRDMYEY